MAKNDIRIEGAKIIYRNFSGLEGQYNNAGNRNFHVLINNEDAPGLQEEGWNIKYFRPTDENEEPQAHLQVFIEFENVPPTVYMITSRGKTRLDQDTIKNLDWAEIENADIVIRPYNWEFGNKRGTKAFVRSLYVTIHEDPFELKYRDYPDSAMSIVTGDADD